MSTNCPTCGRFARATMAFEFDGTWDQGYITTHCAQCGEHTESMV